MNPEERYVDNSLETPYRGPLGSSNLMPETDIKGKVGKHSFSLFRFNARAFTFTGVGFIIIALVTTTTVTFLHSRATKHSAAGTNSNYATTTPTTSGLKPNSSLLQVNQTDRLNVNAQLQVGNTLVLTPTATPSKPTPGQIYYNQTTNTPYYYNGSQFVSLAPTTQTARVTVVSSGVTGTTSLANDGILYGSGSTVIQSTVAAGNSILTTNSLSIPVLAQTLPDVIQGNITGTGQLSSGSIASGFGPITTNNNVITSASIQGGTINTTGTLELGGTDINTTGTLSNIAYLNGSSPQTFGISNIFKGSFLAQNTTDSTTSFQIQNAAGTSNLFIVDTNNGKIGFGQAPAPSGSIVQVNGSLTATNGLFDNSKIVLNNAGATLGRISKQSTAGTGGVAQGDVVVMNSSDQVVDTTTPRDTRVYGVSTAAAAAGTGVEVAIAGNTIVNADSGAVAIGDQLVTSTTSGSVATDNNATAGIIGTATTSKSSGSAGTVGIAVRTIGGQSTPIFSPQADSTTAFQVQNASRTSSVLTVDTTNNRLVVAGDIYSKGTVWTIGNSAADNNWSTVTYGNGLFVAIAYSGSGNRIMTSPDGINWTARSNPVDNNWFGVAYGHGLFVAVSNFGNNQGVMTSPDGINWTARTIAVNNAWMGLTYGNGLFVATGTSGSGNQEAMTSPDGVNWTLRSTPSNNQWRCVTFGNGLFVAVSANGANTQVMTSPDGINWTLRSTPANNNWLWVTYGRGLFVAVANTGSHNEVMTSPDGINWTARFVPIDNSWTAVTYGSGLFVATATSGTNNQVMTSPDGINWTTRTNPVTGQWRGIAYGNGTFVSVSQVGTGNRVMTSGSPDTNPFTSNDSYQGGIKVYGASQFISDTNSTTAFQIQDSNATPLLIADTANEILSVQGTDSAFASLTLSNSHFKSTQTTTPTVGTPINCGSSPSAAISTSSTDSAGSFKIIAGTGSPTTCDSVITFRSAYGSAPKSILITPSTAVAGSTASSAARQVYVSAVTATSFTVKLNSSPASTEVDAYNYWVVE